MAEIWSLEGGSDWDFFYPDWFHTHLVKDGDLHLQLNLRDDGRVEEDIDDGDVVVEAPVGQRGVRAEVQRQPGQVLAEGVGQEVVAVQQVVRQATPASASAASSATLPAVVVVAVAVCSLLVPPQLGLRRRLVIEAVPVFLGGVVMLSDSVLWFAKNGNKKTQIDPLNCWPAHAAEYVESPTVRPAVAAHQVVQVVLVIVELLLEAAVALATADAVLGLVQVPMGGKK